MVHGEWRVVSGEQLMLICYCLVIGWSVLIQGCSLSTYEVKQAEARAHRRAWNVRWQEYPSRSCSSILAFLNFTRIWQVVTRDRLQGPCPGGF
jgi:hypothetical protein